MKEAPGIQVVAEDGFPAVTTIHDGVDRAGILDAEFAGMRAMPQNTARIVNSGRCGAPGLTRHGGVRLRRTLIKSRRLTFNVSVTRSATS